ncbi:DUF3300 domain-containing protein [Paraburkholderia solisilvae]|uniref:DUF3300 domain-containing protein n=1 Tax=Paraburkholderia solisilvae TaxID=624376 RepID=A0A6J5EIX5_9BURK|nr:DUF3300 domain-containing protein [Paraburkholderia solisilvae]CAB3766153.1 hypothetical protein LMG29739_04750 [Paraburkholderia solisilvae]
MKRSRTRQRVLLMCVALAGAPLVVGITTPRIALAQSAAQISSQQLDSLTAPIALYPDALLAQVLMAATFPQQVQDAAQWSKANPQKQGDAAVQAVASQSWDPSVQSLVAFPQVLATMASKPDWVTQLGNAFLAQPNDVMDSVQRLRKQAQQAGNLKTTEQQKVIVEQSTIQIVPANPQVVYVPTYNPTVVYGAWPYPAYPPVYVPPPPGYAIATGFAAGLAFGTGVAVANALWGNFNWNTHDVNINVNRYNNINVNNRINANSTTANWNRNESINRTNANLNRNNANFNQANLAAQRDAYRGRDASRQQAQQALENRTGQNLGGTANQRLQDIRSGGANASQIRNSAQNLNRDNALRGAGDAGTARADMQRGQASRQSFANNSGGRVGAGGAGEQAGANRFGANGGGQRGGGFEGGGGFQGGGQRPGGFGGGGGRHFGRGR